MELSKGFGTSGSGLSWELVKEQEYNTEASKSSYFSVSDFTWQNFYAVKVNFRFAYQNSYLLQLSIKKQNGSIACDFYSNDTNSSFDYIDFKTGNYLLSLYFLPEKDENSFIVGYCNNTLSGLYILRPIVTSLSSYSYEAYRAINYFEVSDNSGATTNNYSGKIQIYGLK